MSGFTITAAAALVTAAAVMGLCCLALSDVRITLPAFSARRIRRHRRPGRWGAAPQSPSRFYGSILRQRIVMLSIGALIVALLAVTGASVAGASTATSCTKPWPGRGILTCMYANGIRMTRWHTGVQYLWVPRSDDMAAAETHYAGIWPSSGFSGRTISLNDGCIVDDNWMVNAATAPSQCMDARTGGSRGITSTEARSVLAFVRALRADGLKP